MNQTFIQENNNPAWNYGSTENPKYYDETGFQSMQNFKKCHPNAIVRYVFQETKLFLDGQEYYRYVLFYTEEKL